MNLQTAQSQAAPFSAQSVSEKAEAQAFARYLKALLVSKDIPQAASRYYSERWPRSVHLENIERRKANGRLEKATVSPIVTGDADALLQDDRLQRSWLAAVQPRTVLGRMAGVRQVPIRLKTPRQTAPAQLKFFGEGQPTPATALAFDQLSLEPLSIGGISCVSQELARSSDPAAELAIRTSFEQAAIAATDAAFLDPTLAPVANVSPGSITNGTPSFALADPNDHDQIEAVFTQMFDAISTDFINPYFVMRPRTAIALSRVTLANGALAYPFVTVVGGTILGIPVITSSSAAQGTINLIDAATIAFADDGIDFDASEQVALQLDDAPSGAAASHSVWQQSQIAYRLIRRINWTRTQDGGVSVGTGFEG